MLEITEKQLLEFSRIERIKILKYIALGLIKFKRDIRRVKKSEINHLTQKIKKT